MKSTYTYPVNYSSALLSAFDIEGSLLMGNIALPTNGLQQDMNRLIKDQKVLEEDYLSACKKLTEHKEDHQ